MFNSATHKCKLWYSSPSRNGPFMSALDDDFPTVIVNLFLLRNSIACKISITQPCFARFSIVETAR